MLITKIEGIMIYDDIFSTLNKEKFRLIFVKLINRRASKNINTMLFFKGIMKFKTIKLFPIINNPNIG